MQVEILETSELGDRSYVVHDGRIAVVIDPQRDLDRVEDLLAELGLQLAAVLETHLHNDYVTGGLALARRAGVDYVLNAADDVAFDRRPVSDGDTLTFGALTVRVLATPGHTVTHLAYVVSDDKDTKAAPAVFSGGSLLYGSVGRTDLVDVDRTDELTRAQWRSARRLATELPADTALYPTHGFGSFCSSGSSAGADGSTLAVEQSRNDALVTDDEDAFVTTLVEGLTAYPAYYAHMGPLNAAGPQAPDLQTPAEVDPAELAARLARGEWVVDLRDRTAYAARHLAGTVGIALGDQFSTYVGWLAPWGEPLTLLGTDAEQVATAQRQLVRIGVDELAGASVGELQGEQLRSYPRVHFSELPEPLPAGQRVLDVRRDDERKAGAVRGSAHVPLHSLLSRLDELPDGRLWVHCASGFRAGIAASLLERAGREVVHIDDDYAAAVEQGLATG